MIPAMILRRALAVVAHGLKEHVDPIHALQGGVRPKSENGWRQGSNECRLSKQWRTGSH